MVFHCDYDLEGFELYTVKWYKDYVEFFGYIPSDVEKVKTHKLDGAYVDVSFENLTNHPASRRLVRQMKRSLVSLSFNVNSVRKC